MPKRQAIAENFHPDLELGNLEPFQLSFAYSGGTDLHLQIKLWKSTKNQGGRCICTEWHPMCIAQAHSLSSYFILPLAWPCSLPYYISIPRLQP